MRWDQSGKQKLFQNKLSRTWVKYRFQCADFHENRILTTVLSEDFHTPNFTGICQADMRITGINKRSPWVKNECYWADFKTLIALPQQLFKEVLCWVLRIPSKVYWLLLRHIWTTVVCTHGPIFTSHKVLKPILVADRSKARVYALWLIGDCGFESRRKHGCLPHVRVVCFQVEVSAKVQSTVQKSPIECGVSECDREISAKRYPGPRGLSNHEQKKCI